MKLISLEFGQTFQPLILEEMRPLGGLHFPSFLAAITARYQFTVSPEFAEAHQSGAKFKEGIASIGSTDLPIKELGVFSDGVIVVAWNTSDADAILSDFVDWAAAEFRLRQPITVMPRRHTSHVVVEFERDLGSFLSVFRKFAETYRAAIADALALDIPAIEVARLAFSADVAQLPPHINTEFVIDRRIGRPFSEKRYFSAAPLATSKHLTLLEAFEVLISPKQH